MSKTKRCQYCGKETPSEAARCSHCRGAGAPGAGVAVLDHIAAVECALSEKYEIIEEIGHGGNATVYQAIQKNLDRKVALKVLLPDLVNDPGYLERFHNEARAIAKLHHPNIVTIYDEGKEQGIHYMAMEFLEGKDLHQVVKEKGALEIAEAVEMAKSIASALDYAHSFGIIHRDVKSSNIIMTSAGTAVLTDFGIAQSGVTSVHTKSGSLLGTPEFMSPEQAGGKTVDPRTDFYSLGVVLYHALSGRYPFQGESPITTIQKILYEVPFPLGRLVKLPPALERAIDRCLAKDPAERVRSGKELIDLLIAAEVETAVRPAGTPAPRAARRTAHRSATGKKGVPSIPPATHQEDAAPKPGNPGSGEVPVHRTAAGGRRPLAGTILMATAACLMLAGYVTWQRVVKADVTTQSAHAAIAALPERKLVPYLIGATKEEALKLLTREGFDIGSVSVVAVPDPAKRGKVDSQRPSHGSLAKPGTTVDLLVGE